MTIPKDDMLELIEDMIKKMCRMSEIVGIKPGRITIHPMSQDFPIKVVRKGFEWLEDIFYSSFKECKRLRKMCDEETWNKYEHFPEETSDFREVLLFNIAGKIFRKDIMSNSRPPLFKKGDQHVYERSIISRQRRLTKNQKIKSKNSRSK